MTSSASHLYRLRADKFDWRIIDDEVVILDHTGSRYLLGNSSATTLWPLLQGGADESTLVEALVSRFRIPSDRATRDVQAFVERLAEIGLVTRLDDS